MLGDYSGSGNAVEYLTNRLSELIQREQRLRMKLDQTRSDLRDACNRMRDWSDEIARFVLNFETEFENASIEDRNRLIRKRISRIIVVREEGTAKVCVRRIPAVTP